MSQPVQQQAGDTDAPAGSSGKEFSLSRVQQVIRDTYGAKDSQRGIEGTFMWFVSGRRTFRSSAERLAA